MKRLLTRILVCTIVLNCAIVLPINAQGELDESYDNMTNEQIVQEALVNPKYTNEQKQSLIEKTLKVQESMEINSTPYASEYVMDVVAIMQETKAYCSAASVQMILWYLGIEPDSQEDIFDYFHAAAGPGFNQVVDYINDHQSRTLYTVLKWNSEDVLDMYCRSAYSFGLPILFSLKAYSNNVNAQNWPYTTSGHFSVIRGYYNNANEYKYSIADPYYFEKWLNTKNIQGYHERSYNDLKTVNGNYDKGYNYLSY